MADSDNTEQAPLPDEPDTVVVDSHTINVDRAELAWSLDDETEPLRRSWHSTWGYTAVIASCGVVAAGVTGLVVWISRSHHEPPPMPPTAQPTTSVAAPSVSAAPAPPTPSTVTQTVTAAPTITTAQASDAANDQLFLHRLATDGFNNNGPEMAGYAHMVCNSLRLGQSEAQVVQWLSAAIFSPADTQHQWATLFVNDAKVSYPNCAP